MQSLAPYSTGLQLVVVCIAMLVMMYYAGRIKSKTQLAMSAVLIVCLGIGMSYLEAQKNARALNLAATIFNIDDATPPMLLKAGGSKGTQTLQIEVIYTLTPQQFEAMRNTPITFNNQTVFEYQTGSWGGLTVDRFAITDNATAWQGMPRKYDHTRYHPERAHYSRQRVPDERDMSGSYTCAFIVIDRQEQQPASGFPVVPCGTPAKKPPTGITILGFLNEKDHTLHISIQ